MANVENKDHRKEVKKRFVKALYSYAPVNNDELQLKVHDILEVIEETEEGWWKGILEGNVGMFPSNFVIELDGHPEEFNNKLMNELSPTKNLSKGKNVVQREPMHRHVISSLYMHAIRENSKQSITDSNRGDEIDGIASSKCLPDLPLDKQILTGRKKAVDLSAPRLPPKPVREQAQALFPYEAQNVDELTLKEGDIITVLAKEVEDKGWWRGELNFRIGVFPDNFVKLIKAEEQKKPERPDKPSTVISSKSSLKSAALEQNESSPKIDKKVMKTPPAKPPPPELHKKDSERPLPPCPSKKPQPPHPVKKPTRISVKSKHQEISSTPLVVPALNSPISEPSPPPPTYPPPSSEKADSSTKPTDKKEKDIKPDKKEKDIKSDKKEKDIKAELEFDAVESNSKKLVHLTANRAKAPNRRPPSLLFLKENEKDADVSVTDSRRRSEPLLAEMESLFPTVNKEVTKSSATLNVGKKPKVAPPRPFLPLGIKITSTIKNNSIAISRGSSSFDEVTTKAPEGEKRDLLSDIIPVDVAPTLRKEIIPQKVSEAPCEVTSKVDVEEPHVNKDIPNTSALVTWKDFNELLKQMKDLKETLEIYKNNSNKAISDLKVELEEEKRLRHTIEVELEKLKLSQTT